MTSTTPESPSSIPPRWPYCGAGAGADDPVGCRGIHVPGHTACLAHLDETHRAAYLDHLAPGDNINHRGTTFTEQLLNRLLNALRDPTTGQPRLGDAWFDEATFKGDAWFARVTFTGNAGFWKATFTGKAEFGEATFKGNAWFGEVTFTGDAGFGEVTFKGNAGFDRVTFKGNASFWGGTFAGHAGFREVTFKGDAWFPRVTFTGSAEFLRATFTGKAEFGEATFKGDAWFYAATFTGHARFWEVTFEGDARFGEVRFETAQEIGPLVCGDTVSLGGVVFGAPVMVEIAAAVVVFRRTRWAHQATLRLRYAAVDLSGAVMEYPVTLAAEPTPFTQIASRPLAEDLLQDEDAGVRVVSVGGVNAAHLTLTDVDVSACRFAGTVHLDQLRLEGRTPFARPPAGWHRYGPVPLRWSRRHTLAEEHHWRATTGRRALGRRSAAGAWQPDPRGQERAAGPETVAVVYRQLRKALEDGKNEPGAADFYYGECEMRRHDRDGTTWAERALLAVYWAVSGYGLRASRALAWLGALMTVTVAVMMLWGLPAHSPKVTTTGRQVDAGQEITLTTDTPDPVNPTGALSDRLTTARLEQSSRVVINSTVFRTSGQDLTTTGTYTEMASRFTEPVLLGMAVLALRSRVKR